MAKIAMEERELAALLARLAEMEKRLGSLETSEQTPAAAAPRTAPPPKEEAPVAAPAPAPPVEELSEGIVSVISAAVAAYFGKRARIRAIHLVSSANWAQQGRASIMASHSWIAQRG
jgi:methylmalonyl-CoA carboxyltransferase large subunit